VRDHIALFGLAQLPCVEREPGVYVMHPAMRQNAAGVRFTLMPCMGGY